ncbi:hypothetical protein CRENPOLYSF2_2310009 [Crenothrix polyspora]|uniref:Uncharacterized protein n=1 Tax=Crenothrix polyspora TaxID=360316 RepID=A0A1R4H612_9GAMM|nr:hypothetical protein CRENPOLYSF2_2310009 [Crenothrix polyspora]
MVDIARAFAVKVFVTTEYTVFRHYELPRSNGFLNLGGVGI